MDNNFYEHVRARLIASQEGHLEKVVAAATDSETRRKAKQAAKARRRHALKQRERKRQERIRAKSRGLWFMLTSLPDNYFEALLSRPPAPGV